MTKTGYTEPVNRWAMWAINSLVIMINRLFKKYSYFCIDYFLPTNIN